MILDPRTPGALAFDALTDIGGRALVQLCFALRDLRGACCEVGRAQATVGVKIGDEDWSRAIGTTLADAVETLAESHGRPLIAAWIREQREALSRAETMPAPAHNDSSNEMEPTNV